MRAMAREAMDIWREEAGQRPAADDTSLALDAGAGPGFTLGDMRRSKPPPSIQRSLWLRRDPTVGVQHPAYFVRGVVIGVVATLALVIFGGVRSGNIHVLLLVPSLATMVELAISGRGPRMVASALASLPATVMTAAFAIPAMYMLDFFNCWMSWLSDC